MFVLCFMFLFYVIITNTMAYWYDGAALAATRSPVIGLFWCLIKFTTTTTTMPLAAQLLLELSMLTSLLDFLSKNKVINLRRKTRM